MTTGCKTSCADFLKTLAANLDAHMKGRSMTIEALALASGVSKRTVVNFLQPRKATPKTTPSGRNLPSGTLVNFFKLAAALDIEPWQLLCDPQWMRFHHGVEQLHHERVRSSGQRLR